MDSRPNSPVRQLPANRRPWVVWRPKINSTPPGGQYSDLMAERICDYVAEGYTPQEYCREIGIAYTTVLHWRRQYPAFREAYRLAQEASAELLAGEALEIADTDTSRQAKNRIQVRQWLSGKLDDAVYGDRQAVTVHTETLEDRLRRLAKDRADRQAAEAARKLIGQESDGSTTITDCSAK